MVFFVFYEKEEEMGSPVLLDEMGDHVDDRYPESKRQQQCSSVYPENDARFSEQSEL